MRFLLLTIMMTYLATSAQAQLQITLKRHSLADTTEVWQLLKLGKQMLAEPRTKIVAAQYFGDAFRLSQTMGFYKGEGYALQSLAMLSVAQKQTYSEEAIGYFRQALLIWEENKNLHEIAETYTNMGDIFVNQWHYYKEGIGYYKQALVLTKRLQRGVETEHLWLKILLASLKANDMEAALPYIKPLKTQYELTGQYEALASMYLAIAKYWTENQAYTKAQQITQEAKQICQAHGGDTSELTAYLKTVQNKHTDTQKMTTDQAVFMLSIIVFIVLFFVGIYFYARRQVQNM